MPGQEMWLVRNLNRLLSVIGIGWEWTLPTFGGSMKDPKELSAAQDAVFANLDYQPTEDGTTFCNLATQDVLRRLGYDALAGLTADEMYAYVSTSPDWLIKVMADVQGLANEGTIILGILPASKLGESHGHVNTITPAPKMDFSGTWNVATPMCMNLGRIGTCFRSRGENWAFQVIPEFYALKITL